MLERNTAYLQENAQPREGFGRGSYGGREKQIVWRIEDQNFREEAQSNWEKQGLARDSNTIDINRERRGDRTCYMYEKQGHIAKNCWQRKI